MELREFYRKIRGGDELHVLIVVDGVATYEVHDVEQGRDNDTGREELWIVAGDVVDEGE